MSVTVRSFDLYNPLAYLQNRNVEGAAAKIEHRDRLVGLLVQPVGQGGGCRLIDNPHHLKTSDLASIFSGLSLGVIKVGGYRDDSLRDLLAKIRLGGLSQFLEDHR